MNTPDVSTPSAEADAMAPALELISDIRGGLPRMRARSSIYLPKYANEDRDDYARRIGLAPWRAEFADALRTLSSRPFEKPVSLGPDAPEPIVRFADDVDGCGNNLHTWARKLFEAAVADGVALVLIDHPRADGVRTLADYKAAGLRPYWALYPASTIISLRMARVGARKEIVDLRLRESVTVPDGWGEKVIEQVRRLTPGHFEIWRKNAREEWELAEEGDVTRADGSRVVGIDAVILRTGEAQGDLQTRPPLLDLAYLQVELWKALSNLAECLEFSASPMLVGKNLGVNFDSTDEVKVGPRAVLQCGENGDWKFIQPDAANIAEIKGHVRDVIADMQRLSLQPLLARPGTTATEVSLQAAKAHSALEAWALGLKDALQTALQRTIPWMTDDERKAIGAWAPVVDVHSDFASEIGKNEEARVIVDATKAGLISAEIARAELLRRGVIRELEAEE
jgi:hypothetical protein